MTAWEIDGEKSILEHEIRRTRLFACGLIGGTCNGKKKCYLMTSCFSCKDRCTQFICPDLGGPEGSTLRELRPCDDHFVITTIFGNGSDAEYLCEDGGCKGQCVFVVRTHRPEDLPDTVKLVCPYSVDVAERVFTRDMNATYVEKRG